MTEALWILIILGVVLFIALPVLWAFRPRPQALEHDDPVKPMVERYYEAEGS